MQCIATAIRISFHGKHGLFTSLRGRAMAAIDDRKCDYTFRRPPYMHASGVFGQSNNSIEQHSVP